MFRHHLIGCLLPDWEQHRLQLPKICKSKNKGGDYLDRLVLNEVGIVVAEFKIARLFARRDIACAHAGSVNA